MPVEFHVKVVAVVATLTPGEVVSYGDVAAQAGYPGAGRGVGSVLAHSDGLPWWRVVMASGRLAPGKERVQARLLQAEGVKVSKGRVSR
jgi:methylated-DNA-protein-cysteine methyltransferase-like protein